MNKNRNFTDDILVVDEELVDINYGTGDDESDSKGKKNKSKAASRVKKDNGKKKLIVIISSVAAVLAVAAGVTGFCLFSGVLQNEGESVEPTEFTFSEGTVVSGVSIGGKTYEEAKAALEAKKDSFIKPIAISVDIDGTVVNLTESDFEYTYDIEEVLSEIKSDAANSSSQSVTGASNYEITASVTEESVESAAQKVSEDNEKEPQNATVTEFTPFADNDDERFEYQDEEKGLAVDESNLSNQLKGVFASGKNEYRIIAEYEETDPEITVDDLKENIVKLSTYTTVSTNTSNGTENMRVSLKACNGSIIEPGATWSFNECTGNSNLESLGYKPAGVISNGESTIGIGGGICQSSSTIYNAGLRANMEIVERYCHKWASTYVPTGLDATIDYGNLDLKMKNITDYQMFLECKVVDSTLYVSFWGYQSDSYDLIMTENEISDVGSSSYTVNAWRVYYKDGKKVDSEKLQSSTYDLDNGEYFISAENDSRAIYDDDVTIPDDDDSDDDDDSGSSGGSGSSSASQTSYTSSSRASSQSSHSSSKPSSSSRSSHASSDSSSSQASSKPSSSSSSAHSEPSSSADDEVSDDE